MSFFDDSSLAFLPSGAAGKDGKAYSIKPTDGTGDFTFSRGSNLTATRVGPTGLIEKGRENLLLQSNNFGTTWTISEGTILGGQTGYDGSSDAWLYTDNVGATSKSHDVRQSVSESGVNCFSIYAKMGTKDWVKMYNGQNTCFFNIDPNYVGNRVGTDGTLGGRAEDVGNGWFRLSVFDNGSASLILFGIAGGDGTGNYISDGTGTIYIQDAQLELGLAATDYIESGASTGKAGLLENEPRFDYSGGATCPSLLLEPSRTNLIGQSEYIGGVFSGTRMDINDVVDTSPEGVVNASKIIPTTDAGTHQAVEGNIGNFSINDKVTTSVFAKADGYDGIYLRYISSSGAFTANHVAFFDLSRGRWYNSDTLPFDGSVGAMSGEVGMEDMGNGWYRCFATATADAAGDLNLMISTVDVTAIDTYNDNFTGDGTSGVLLYGAQVEAGSYPTSYIPNHSGGTITRGVDSQIVLTTAGTDGILNNYNTSVYIETKKIFNDNSLKRIVSLFADNKVANPRVLLYAISTSIFLQYRVSGQSDIVIPISGVDLDAVNKFAIVLNDTSLSLYHNGSLIQTITIVKGLNFEEFYLGENAENGYSLKQTLIFPESLSQADAETLTTL